MINDESEDRPQFPRLISVNADLNIEINRAKQQVASTLAILAAAILKNVAGSPSAPAITQCALDYVDAQRALVALAGYLLPREDEKLALSLSDAQLSSQFEIYPLEFDRASVIAQIVRGSLRCAAHQVAKEREPFSGKYSTRAVEEGITRIVRASQIRKRNRREVDL